MGIKGKIFFSLLGIILIGGIFWIGNIIGYYSGKNDCQICKPEDIDFSLFWESYYALKENSVYKEKLDDSKNVIYGAISGMVKSLGDPYTVFLSPEDSKVFEEDTKGFFEGIGAEISIRNNQLQVIAPLKGAPAERAGLKAGDKILKIDDKETVDLNLHEAVKLIRGPKGTKVSLTIFREGWEEPKTIEIKREVIEITSLEWEIKEGDIAYIKLNNFSQKASIDFANVAFEILNSPAKRIILDLRNNPGGFLEVAQDISGWFLEKGEVIVIEDFGEKKVNFFSKGPSKLSSYPIVILINKGSASASEILAGALRDNRGVKLIGEKSFGKGSVQTVKKLKNGSSLTITVARWLTPSGNNLIDNGLEPDIKVEMKNKENQEDKDYQLDKAIEIVKNL